MEHGLGWLPRYDERSKQYKAAAIAEGVPRSHAWKCDTWLDQGSLPSCVGFAWAHELAAGPLKQRVDANVGLGIYQSAQAIDEWPEGTEGTSILAGAHVVQASWHVKTYRWCFTLDDLILTLGWVGPVVIGVNWYAGMMTPDGAGFIRPIGDLVGGHAILARGVSVELERVRLHNSWGRSWGVDGECFISWDDLGTLIAQGAEMCVAADY